MPDVAGETVGAAQKHRQPLTGDGFAGGVPGLELVGFEADGTRLVGDVVRPPAAYQCQLTRGELEMHGHLLVTRVSPEGPADKAGVRNGDVVVGVGADPVKSQEELYRKVWALGAAGIDVPLRILKGADVRELRLRSIDRFQYFREKPTY